MSKQGTWCDNIIMQAVANAYNCVIHITQSNINSPESTILTPVADQDGRKTIFIGYINELHYVSTLTDKNNSYRKRTSEETVEKRKERLANRRASYKRSQTISAGQKESSAGPVHEQKHAQNNMNDFHKSNQYSVCQCTVCFEAWPLKSSPRKVDHYQCQRCIRDKQQPKKVF
ncbi:unnamed protein product [Porites lobata]|uniref:OTU domain-containing protein n=1 Tax=Porites lobata TaxID=104759 RepID=A0ABN8PBG2_9CNID|nr:unnamed protein product [Porites lobata]